MAQGERSAPLLAPSLDVRVVVGPGKVAGELLGHVVEVERGVEVVPAEYLEGREVVAVLSLREVGEGDPPLVALAVVRNEE